MTIVQPIEVAAGVLTDTSGRVLLMQRLPGKHLAGLWEFPGGKLEPGETIEQALSRELDEELGIRIIASSPLISIPWQYPEKSVRLHAWHVSDWQGGPCAREGHPLRWVHMPDLDVATMPPADAPIVAALRLPAYYAISDGAPGKKEPDSFLEPSDPNLPAWGNNDPDPFWDFPLVQLRMPDAPRAEVRRVAMEWLASDPTLRARLLINHDIDLAQELGVGVHLRAAQLRELHEHPLPRDAWVGASCHDANELELAARLGADFATLSPVCATASHPDATPLGWSRFAQLVAEARLPVYALGGVGPDDLEHALVAGAQGVAGIRAFR
ncbi:MAG: Nudix family hydrolase [Rhodanobacteraceae bacterium]